jgi:hypothetical protein
MKFKSAEADWNTSFVADAVLCVQVSQHQEIAAQRPTINGYGAFLKTSHDQSPALAAQFAVQKKRIEPGTSALPPRPASP